MTMCTDHWAALRAAIDDRGLGALVPESGEQAASNLLNAQIEGVTIDNFDPLMMAHRLILGNVISMLGGVAPARVLVSGVCPICFCNNGDPANCTPAGRVHDYDPWIGLAADEALARWKALG